MEECPFCSRIKNYFFVMEHVAFLCQMEDHLDKECPRKEIKCPFNIVGCTFEVLNKFHKAYKYYQEHIYSLGFLRTQRTNQNLLPHMDVQNSCVLCVSSQNVTTRCLSCHHWVSKQKRFLSIDFKIPHR